MSAELSASSFSLLLVRTNLNRIENNGFICRIDGYICTPTRGALKMRTATILVSIVTLTGLVTFYALMLALVVIP
jgi:hypothetical protein